MRKRIRSILLTFFLLFSTTSMREPIEDGDDLIFSKASWYGDRFRGNKTASGLRFNPDRLTAAHKTLPFGTKVRVTNIRNNKSVVVVINDRGPFIATRDIDLSRAAFDTIANLNRGVIKIKYQIL